MQKILTTRKFMKGTIIYPPDLDPNLEIVENPITEFHAAASQGDLKKLRQLLDENSVGLNVVDKDGNTALHLGAKFDQTEIINELIKRRANPNIRNNARTSVVFVGAGSLTDRKTLQDLLTYSQDYRLDLNEWEMVSEKKPSSRPSSASPMKENGGNVLGKV